MLAAVLAATKANYRAASGASWPAPANCAECVGVNVTQKERRFDMLANATDRKNSKSTQTHMRDGDEPTEVLLALVSSPLLTLLARNVAQVATATDSHGQRVLAVVFANTSWSPTVGITLLPTLANTANSEEAQP